MLGLSDRADRSDQSDTLSGLAGWHRLIGIVLLLVFGLPCWSAPNIPTLPDAATATARLTQALAAGRCYVADLGTGTSGTLVKGSSQVGLPRGMYRLHCPLAMAPLGDLRVSEISITIRAGASTRTLRMIYFPSADEFVDFPLEFAAAGTNATPISVSWAIEGHRAKINRTNTGDLPADPEQGEAVADDNLPEMGEDATIGLADLAKVKYHLAALPLYLESLGPLDATVAVDKIVYKPGEQGTASVTLKNLADTPQRAQLHVELLSGLQERAEVAAQLLDVPAHGERTWSGPFTIGNRYWGAEIRATVQVGEAHANSKSAVFAIAKNMWEVAVVAGTNYTYRFQDRDVAERTIDELRTAGFTALESGFWAPDDFLGFVPDKELYYGGHLCYKNSTSGTKNYLDCAHKYGMRAAVYSLTWGGSGPPVFEQMRLHPDWFTDAEFYADWLENWPMMEREQIPPMAVWPSAGISSGNDAGFLKRHAEQFVASHRQIGWDATRYDVYTDIDPWVISATKRVRAMVAKEEPDYQWGFNTEVSEKVPPAHLDVMLGNGGLLMNEELRNISRGRGSFAAYLKEALYYRDIVWAHNGHLGICYDAPSGVQLQAGGVYATKLDAVYQNILLLAAGGHPFYSSLERSIGQYNLFALRYAEFIWNNSMRPLKNPAVIAVPANTELMAWQTLARKLDLPDGRHRLVVHLINPPARDDAHDPAMSVRPPMRNLPLTITLPEGAKVDGAYTLTAQPVMRQESLPLHQNGPALTLTIPEVRLWTVVVVEYSGKAGVE